METVLEVMVMIFLYTNDKLPQKLMKALSSGIKILLVGVAFLIVIYFKKQGVTLETAARIFRLAGAADDTGSGLEHRCLPPHPSGPGCTQCNLHRAVSVTVAVMITAAVRMNCEATITRTPPNSQTTMRK